MTFDLDKVIDDKVTNSQGEDGRIICRDLPGKYPLAVSWDRGDHVELQMYTRGGLFNVDRPDGYLDLVNTPPPQITRWVHYGFHCGVLDTLWIDDTEDVTEWAKKSGVVTVPVTLEGPKP